MITFHLNPQNGQWTLADRKTGFGLFNATCVLEVNGRTYAIRQADRLQCRRENPRSLRTVVKAQYRRPGFDWTMTFTLNQRSGSLRLSSRIANVSGQPLTLGRCRLVELDGAAGGRLNLGPHAERQTFFDYHENIHIQQVKRLTADRGRHASQIFCHVFNPSSHRVFFAGFTSFDRLHTVHELVFRRSAGLAPYRAICDFNGHPLQPGAEIRSEELEVRLAQDPYGVLEDWAVQLQRRYHPPIPEKAPVGWCGFAWVDCWLTERYDQVVRRNAAGIRRRLPGYDIEYIWMSIGNLHKCFPGNWLKFNRELFPQGMNQTLRSLRNLRFKPGFWIAPFWVFGETEALKQNQANLLRRDDGTTWCSPRQKDRLWIGATRPHDFYLLDPTHPRTMAYFRKVFAAYRKMGLRYYMIDFISSGYLYRHDRFRLHDPATRVIGPESYRHALSAIRQAAGAGTHLLSAVGLPITQTGIMNATRVSTDYGEGRPLTAQSRATYVMNRRGWSGHDEQLQNLASTWFTHRRLYLNDLNLLTVDKPIPRNEAEISTTLFGMSGSPIMLGDDVATLDPERLAMIKKCLPRTRDTARAVDLFDRVFPEDYPRVLVLPVKSSWDRWLLVAVFNLGQTALQEKLDFKQLGLETRRRYWGFDFWQEGYLGAVQSSFNLAVPPESCRLLRFTAGRDYPWVLSTNMHVHQGEVDLADVAWDARRRVLQGRALRPRGEHGNLFIIMPPGWKLADYRGIKAGQDFNDEQVILRRELSFDRPSVAWQLEFKKLPAGRRPIPKP